MVAASWLGRTQQPFGRLKMPRSADAIRPYIRTIHSQLHRRLANGGSAAVGWSGDIRVPDRAEEAGNVIRTTRAGALMWFDMYAIPADALPPECAYSSIHDEAGVAAQPTVYHGTRRGRDVAGTRRNWQRPGHLPDARGAASGAPIPAVRRSFPGQRNRSSDGSPPAASAADGRPRATRAFNQPGALWPRHRATRS
jgi:hypothetical protein